MQVVLLWHVHPLGDGQDDEKLIGVYSTEELAQRAIERRRDQPGFREWPEGFQLHSYSVDDDSGWPEGYLTVCD